MDRPYERLIVWQEAHKLCLWIYEHTKNFPVEERYGLTSQIRRSAYSVPTNIAEGNGRHSYKEKRHFFEISQGSLEEVHYQGRLARDLKYISPVEFSELDSATHKVSYLLTKLRSSVVAHPRHR